MYIQDSKAEHSPWPVLTGSDILRSHSIYNSIDQYNNNQLLGITLHWYWNSLIRTYGVFSAANPTFRTRFWHLPNAQVPWVVVKGGG